MERELLLTSELGRGLDALEAALRRERVPEAAVLELRLVAEEVLTNVAKYAHDGEGERRVRVRLTVASGVVTLRFADDGRPFDPVAAGRRGGGAAGERATGGLGIRLMLSLVDGAEYVRLGSENVLTLTKRVGLPPGGAP